MAWITRFTFGYVSRDSSPIIGQGNNNNNNNHEENNGSKEVIILMAIILKFSFFDNDYSENGTHWVRQYRLSLLITNLVILFTAYYTSFSGGMASETKNPVGSAD